MSLFQIITYILLFLVILILVIFFIFRSRLRIQLFNTEKAIKNVKTEAVDKVWWRDAELNCGHMDFQSTALPTELSRQLLVQNGGADGICSFVSLSFAAETRTPSSKDSVRPFKSRKHAPMACLPKSPQPYPAFYLYKMAELTGFEPAISCVTGMCPKPLDDSST